MEQNFVGNRSVRFIQTSYNTCYRISLMIPFIVFKAAGVAPWVFNFSLLFDEHQTVINPNIKFRMSFYGSYYNIFIGVVTLLINYYYLCVMVDDKPRNIEKITSETIKYLQCASFSSVIPILINYVFRQEAIIEFLNYMQNTKGRAMKNSIYKLRNSYFAYFIFIINLITFIALVSINIMLQRFLMLLMLGMPSIAYNWMMIQGIMTLDLLIRRIETVKVTIMKMGNIKDGDEFSKDRVSKITFGRGSVNREVNNVKRAYIEISVMCENILMFYLLPVFFTLSYMGFMGTFMVYEMRNSVLGVKRLETLEMVLYGTWLIWMGCGITLLGINLLRAKAAQVKTKHYLAMLLKFDGIEDNLDNEPTAPSQARLDQEVEANNDIVSLDDSAPQYIGKASLNRF
ncbi:uncharacterized protein LOC130672760 [Microplitis mediator]|uniref:uncharacterized protein LOC130672760 n=1 Tax=Microplitis mediator TaxID=375433 RepID=UPI0025555C64|nr:uncharacterized protein LOC130672760 [Microplitis mediator]